jgi:hypothetical protein
LSAIGSFVFLRRFFARYMKKYYIIFFLLLVVSWHTSHAQSLVYTVNRSFSDGVNVATLNGTVEIPVGNYIIQNSGPSPFTAVNLALTVQGSSYDVDNVLTGEIVGTAKFFIDANSTDLTFNTANFSAGDPADLVFSDVLILYTGDRYGIGSDGNPTVEVAFTASGDVISGGPFPTVFGTVVPEPSALALTELSGLLLLFFCRQFVMGFKVNPLHLL